METQDGAGTTAPARLGRAAGPWAGSDPLRWSGPPDRPGPGEGGGYSPRSPRRHCPRHWTRYRTLQTLSRMPMRNRLHAAGRQVCSVDVAPACCSRAVESRRVALCRTGPWAKCRSGRRLSPGPPASAAPRSRRSRVRGGSPTAGLGSGAVLGRNGLLGGSRGLHVQADLRRGGRFGPAVAGHGRSGSHR